jgi:hypothetical protein
MSRARNNRPELTDEIKTWISEILVINGRVIITGVGSRFGGGVAFEGQLHPRILVESLADVVEEGDSKFRNVIPEQIGPWIDAIQSKLGTRGRVMRS